MAVNEWHGIGNLVRDPEAKFTPSGAAVTTFDIAISEKFKDRSGQMQERTEYVPVVTWQGLAENCGKFLSRGKKVYVRGKLQTRSWEKDGVKHYKTEVIAADVQFLSPKEEGGRRPERQPSQPEEPPFNPDDDIPF